MGKTAQPLEHHWLGYAYEQLDMRVNAVREYEKAISLGIERMDTYLALAGLYSGWRRIRSSHQGVPRPAAALARRI